ncbi:leucine-rich repeat domain-containing protein, partial [Flavivirga sp. 57AJ16]|uniref:leucine-rich repeat domain-containing protein n=1 Tax=Flavivirga sp. 57AJ16 TaxID=3025307 RepID=UPI0023668129
PTVEIKESPTATGAIDIPETVTHEDIIYRVTVIGDEAFAGNGLTSVTIPDNVTSIGSRAFYDNVLTSVTIGNSVTAIGAYAFRNNAITSVVIPDSVTDIGFDAFAHNALTSVTIANSGVTAIGRGAFSYNNLTSVTIPDSVTAISYGAFDKNPLTEVIVQSAIPASIEDTSFGNRAIVYLNVPESLKQDYINSGWTGFQDQPVETFTQDNVNYVKTGEASAIVIQSPKATGAIEIPEAIIYQGITYNVTAIEDYAFAYNALTSVTIGNSVTTIGYRAFLHNGLTSVTIGNSVTAIGDEAFRGNALEKVMAKGMTPATILSDTFGNREEIALMIPEGTKEAYEAAGWTGFKSITEDDETLSITDKDLNTSVHLILKDSYLKIQSTQANLKAYAIYNILGVNILKGTADKVAVDRLSSGMYIAVLSFDKGTMSKKFIIE